MNTTVHLSIFTSKVTNVTRCYKITKKKRATSKEATIAALPSSNHNTKPDVTNSFGKSFKDVPPNGCAYHYFSTTNGCRFGSRCNKNHGGSYGSLGPYPYSSTTRNNQQNKPNHKTNIKRSNRQFQPRKDVKTCTFCHKKGHIEKECYKKRLNSNNETKTARHQPTSTSNTDLIAVIKSLQEKTNDLEKQLKAHQKDKRPRTVSFWQSKSMLYIIEAYISMVRLL